MTLESEAQIVLGIISIIIALPLVYLFFKVYRTQRSIFLLGLPFGFLLLSFSYLFLGIHLAYPNIQVFSVSLMWLRVITQTSGFGLIAFSYFFSNKTQKSTKYSLLTISLALIAAISLLFGSLVIINPPGLSSIYSFNQIFTFVNLGLLSYIILFLIRKLELSSGNGNISGLISAPLAFAALWLGQFSFLIWDIDGSEAALFGSQIARIASLVMFIRIYYLASKEAPPIDSEQTK